MSRFVFIVICLLFVLPLNGCDFKDIDKRFFVVAIGIDTSEKFEKGYRVSLKLALPTSDPTVASSKFLLVSEEAQSVSEAVRMIKSRVDKDLDFGHAKLIVIGKKLTHRDMNRTMDWFLRRRDIQQISWVAIGSPNAKKVLQQKPKGERLPSSVLFQLFGDTGTESPHILYTYLFDFLRRLREPGIDASLPIIETGKESVYKIEKTALFKNGKAALTLHTNDTKFLNIAARSYSKADIHVKTDENYFVLATDDCSVSYSIHTANKKEPYINMYIKMKGIIEESREPLKESRLHEYEILVSKEIKQRVSALLEKFQKKQVDPLGFGLRFRSRHIGDDKELAATWKKLYPKIQFRVYVNTNIQGTGRIE